MKLLQLLLPVLVSAVLFACQASGPGQVMRNGRPAFAGVVCVETELEAALLSRRVREKLEEAGYRCSGAMILRTEPLKSGLLWTRVTVEIVGPVASASSEWAVAAEEEPFWRVARNAEGSAEEVFLDLCRLLEGIPNLGVSYRFE